MINLISAIISPCGKSHKSSKVVNSKGIIIDARSPYSGILGKQARLENYIKMLFFAEKMRGWSVKFGVKICRFWGKNPIIDGVNYTRHKSIVE